MDKQRARKNLRTALMLGSIALLSLLAFVHKIWNLG
jgi:hypothetical protein